MSARLGLPALLLAALVAGCGGSGQRHEARPPSRPAPAAGAGAAAIAVAARPATATTRRAVAGPRAQALVTAETEDRLLVVDLPSGRVSRRVALAPDPEDVAADLRGGVVVVVSSAAGKVTLLRRDSLRPIKVFGGFDSPHIPALSPGGEYAYVTDDARGTVTAIDLGKRRVTSTIEVGAGAHHLSFDLMHQLAWVALGESARTIVILETADLAHPRVIGRFDPGFPAHDVSFSPDGQQVWITSAIGPDAAVFSGIDQRLLFHVPVGPPPQHVVFDGRYAYLTSGYGGRIEKVDAATGRVLARAVSPYGSFELDAGDGYVVTSSLLRGTLAIYNGALRLLRVIGVAPAAREVAISTPCAGSQPC